MKDPARNLGTREPSVLPFFSIYLVCAIGFWFCRIRTPTP